ALGSGLARHADLGRLLNDRVLGIRRDVEPIAAGLDALVIVAAVAIAVALAAAAGPRSDLVGAQALGQADFGGQAIVAHAHVLGLGITRDRQELARVDLDAHGLLRAHAERAVLDDALALALGVARDVGHVALAHDVEATVDPALAWIADLGLTREAGEHQRTKRESPSERSGA